MLLNEVKEEALLRKGLWTLSSLPISRRDHETNYSDLGLIECAGNTQGNIYNCIIKWI